MPVTPLETWALTALTAVLTCGVIALLRLVLPSALLQDVPNRPNAMHHAAVPRIGGLAMWIAAATVVAFATRLPDTLAVTMLLALILGLLSLADDALYISPWLRLAAHFAAATVIVLVWFRGSAVLGLPTANFVHAMQPLTVALTIFVIVWMTNVFNFMDGANGLAGGMAVFGFGAYAVAANDAPVDTATFAAISTVIAATALGFLVFNFPKARVFMGDAGSIPLGFLSATLGIHGYLVGTWPWWFPLLVFSPFWIDATVTLVKRILAGKKIWHAHREHYYHRLILGGNGHTRTALGYFALMFAASATALALRKWHSTDQALQLAALIGWVLIYGLLILALEIRLARTTGSTSETHIT